MTFLLRNHRSVAAWISSRWEWKENCNLWFTSPSLSYTLSPPSSSLPLTTFTAHTTNISPCKVSFRNKFLPSQPQMVWGPSHMVWLWTSLYHLLPRTPPRPTQLAKALTGFYTSASPSSQREGWGVLFIDTERSKRPQFRTLLYVGSVVSHFIRLHTRTQHPSRLTIPGSWLSSRSWPGQGWLLFHTHTAKRVEFSGGSLDGNSRVVSLLRAPGHRWIIC